MEEDTHAATSCPHPKQDPPATEIKQEEGCATTAETWKREEEQEQGHPSKRALYGEASSRAGCDDFNDVCE